MIALQNVLSELGTEIRTLSKRSITGLFWACSSGLMPEFRTWATAQGQTTEPILDLARLKPRELVIREAEEAARSRPYK